MKTIKYAAALSALGAVACGVGSNDATGLQGHEVSSGETTTRIAQGLMHSQAQSQAQNATPNQAATAQFNLDTGRAVTEIVFPALASPELFNSPIEQGLNPGDVSFILRGTALLGVAWFDAIAPYHPTAVGVYSRLGRRPASERTTFRQRNIAILYASMRVMNSVDPPSTAVWRRMLTTAGLDPDDNSMDPHTAVGIGNLAGKAVVEAREHDGMNQLGDEDRKYNFQPFADYTGYVPVNTAFEIIDAGRWQPLLVTTGNGIFRTQHFVTPQVAITEPFLGHQLDRLHAPPPRASNPRNSRAYRKQVDDLLAAQASLNDEQKMTSELFNNKFISLKQSHEHIIRTLDLGYDEEIQFRFLLGQALFDALIVTWREKYRYDAVRPFTAIRYLYGNRKITAWGGPGRGTVSDITGNEWKSYIPTADHPDYPSGSACFCAVQSEVSRLYLGSDNLEWSVTFPMGSSGIEPGITPSKDLTLTFNNWTEFETRCAQSRHWSGVHFQAAVVEGARLCRNIAAPSIQYLRDHVNGSARPAVARTCRPDFPTVDRHWKYEPE